MWILTEGVAYVAGGGTLRKEVKFRVGWAESDGWPAFQEILWSMVAGGQAGVEQEAFQAV